MAKKNYEELASRILELVGGKDNVSFCTHCITRIRFIIKDRDLIDEEQLNKTSGVLGTQWAGDQFQVVIGQDVNEVYKRIVKLGGFEETAEISENLDENTAKQPFNWKKIPSYIVDAILAGILPTLPALIGFGLVKALCTTLTSTGWVGADNTTIATLAWASDVLFYFFPIIIAGNVAKKYKGNPVIAMALGGVLVAPNFVSMVANGDAGAILGMTIPAFKYNGTILPAVMIGWFSAKLENFIYKKCPDILKSVLPPFLVCLITIPLSLLVFAPLANWIGLFIGGFIMSAYLKLGGILVAVYAALAPFLTITGVSKSILPVSAEFMSQYGYDPLILPACLMSNIAQGAACLGVGIKTKSKELKPYALSCSFSNLVPGISEPGMYGVTLKYKTPMLAAVIGSACGGLFIGVMKVGCNLFSPPNTFALPFYVNEGNNLLMMIIGLAIAFVVTLVLTFVLYKDSGREAEV